LDLFTGLGGVARGFQSYLEEHSIEFEYVAVEIDRCVAWAHKLLNPNSQIIIADAYSLSDDFLRQFDFIWASPPCETHSRANFFHFHDPKRFKEPDMRLYGIVSRLMDLRVPFVVENVEPYYRPPIQPRTKVCWHRLWTNLPTPSEIPCPMKGVKFFDVKDDAKMLIEYHELEEHFVELRRRLGTVRRLRDALRDMVHWRIAYIVASVVIPLLEEPKLQLTLEVGE